MDFQSVYNSGYREELLTVFKDQIYLADSLESSRKRQESLVQRWAKKLGYEVGDQVLCKDEQWEISGIYVVVDREINLSFNLKKQGAELCNVGLKEITKVAPE